MDINMKEQLIWYRKDIPIFEDLLTFKQGLIDDFMAGYNDLASAVMRPESINSIDTANYSDEIMKMAEGMLVTRDSTTLQWSTNFNSWRSLAMNNIVKIGGEIKENLEIDEESAKKFPTGVNLLNKYRHGLFGVVYSSIAPYTILHRHVGPENIDGEYVRIHLPLIVPEGDVFLEVQGQEVEWNDIFAFNNQYLHSAYNFSKEWRLIMIIDMARELCDLPPGRHYTEGGTERENPFVRGWPFPVKLQK